MINSSIVDFFTNLYTINNQTRRNMELISHYKVFHDKSFVVEYHERQGTLENLKAFKISEASDLNYSQNYENI